MEAQAHHWLKSHACEKQVTMLWGVDDCVFGESRLVLKY